VAEKYQRAAASVVQRRLAQAGIRLAMVLNDAAKAAQSTKTTAAPPNLPLASTPMNLPFCGSTPISCEDRRPGQHWHQDKRRARLSPAV